MAEPLKSDGPGKGRIEESSEIIDSEGERKVLRKIDLHLIPFIMALYLFSFLDRGENPLWFMI